MPIYLGDNNITGGFTTAEKNQFNNSINLINEQMQTKTDDNLTTTSKEVVGAINEVKILNDTKLNKTDANKLNCVTIDNVSLKEYILTNLYLCGMVFISGVIVIMTIVMKWLLGKA